MQYTKENIQKAAQELNDLGFEPAINIDKNVDKAYLELEITGRVISLIHAGFEKNKALAINVFVDLMKNKLSDDTLNILKHLLENCNAKEVIRSYTIGLN